MRTISIVFALAVVGGTAPAASYAPGHLSLALLVFAAALAVFLTTCLVSGWFLSELRTLMRQRSGDPVARAPLAAWLVYSSPVGRRRLAARAPEASASPRSRPSQPVPVER